jgi:two-component system OmpR family response regulator
MKTILIVEDDGDVAAVVDTNLRRIGFKAIVAENGKDALLALDHHSVDLVVCNRRMPMMSGYELLSHIRHNKLEFVTILFMFLTGLGDSRDIHTVSDLRPDACLTKPIDFPIFLDVVRYLVGEIAAPPATLSDALVYARTNPYGLGF